MTQILPQIPKSKNRPQSNFSFKMNFFTTFLDYN